MLAIIKPSEIPLVINKGIISFDTKRVINRLKYLGMDEVLVRNIIYTHLHDAEIQGMDIDAVSAYLEEKTFVINNDLLEGRFHTKNEELGNIFFNPRDFYNINDIEIHPNFYSSYALPGSMVTFRVVKVADSLIQQGVMQESERQEFGRVVYTGFTTDRRYPGITTLRSLVDHQQAGREIAAEYIDSFIAGRFSTVHIESFKDRTDLERYIIFDKESKGFTVDINRTILLLSAFNINVKEAEFDELTMRIYKILVDVVGDSQFDPEKMSDEDIDLLGFQFNEDFLNVIYYNAVAGVDNITKIQSDIPVLRKLSQIEIEKYYYDACMNVATPDFISDVLVDSYGFVRSDAYQPSIDLNRDIMQMFDVYRKNEDRPYELYKAIIEMTSYTIDTFAKNK